MNEQALKHLLYYGIMLPGESIWRDGECEDPQFFLDYSKNHITDTVVSAQSVLESFEQAVDKIIQAGSCSALALSGGLDSRLLFYILYKNHRSFLKQTYTYCRVHSQLDAHSDRDYVLAKQLCDQFEVPLQLEQKSDLDGFYLLSDRQQEGLTLSSLWGGELLGGQLIDQMTFKLSQLDLLSPQCEFEDYISQSLYEENLDLCLFYYLMKKTEYSCFYTQLTWLRPFRALDWVQTPFLDETFLKQIFTARFHGDDFNDYSFYEKIYHRIDSDFKTVPINNTIAPFLKGQKLPGIEAKTLNSATLKPSKPEVPVNQKLRDYIHQNRSAPFADYLDQVIKYISGHR